MLYLACIALAAASGRPLKLARIDDRPDMMQDAQIIADWSRLLGQGSFGYVVTAVRPATATLPEKRYALKVVDATRSERQAQGERDAFRRLRESTADRLGADKVVDCDAVYSVVRPDKADHLYFYFLLEPLGESLAQVIARNGKRGLPLSFVKPVMKALLEAVTFCHASGVIHADIKPQNVLITGSNFKNRYRKDLNGKRRRYELPDAAEVKLVDFGNAYLCATSTDGPTCTVCYRPPECVLGLTWDALIDEWSCGCVFVELLTGSVLFPVVDNTPEHMHLRMMERCLGLEIPQAMKRASPLRLRAPICMHLADERPVLAEMFRKSPETQSVIRSMLTALPSERGNARDILSHRFFRN